MTRFVALLRGINVGGNKRVPMAQLSALLEGLGHSQVATLLQSGNAVFTCRQSSESKVGRALEAAIASEFGFEISVVLRTAAQFADAVEANPFPDARAEPSRFLLFFLSAPPDPERMRELEPARYLPDEFRLNGREIYARFPDTIRDSKLAVVLGGKKLGITATARNWNTVLKLRSLVDGG